PPQAIVRGQITLIGCEPLFQSAGKKVSSSSRTPWVTLTSGATGLQAAPCIVVSPAAYAPNVETKKSPAARLSAVSALVAACVVLVGVILVSFEDCSVFIFFSFGFTNFGSTLPAFTLVGRRRSHNLV